MSRERELTIRYLLSDDNENNLRVRVRNIPVHVAKKTPLQAAAFYCNNVLNARVRNEDIEDCYYTDDWVKKGRKNLIIVFINIELRDGVYHKRSFENGEIYNLCDDLDGERLTIWKVLFENFKEDNVITDNGGIVLFHNSRDYLFVLNKELEYLFSNKNIEYFLLNRYYEGCFSYYEII